MKIALIHLYLATASGDPRMVLSVAQEMKKQGHQVVVYCSEFDPKQLPNLVKDMDIRVVPPRAPLQSVLGASSLHGKIAERLRRRDLYTDAAYRIEQSLDPDFDYVFCENDYSYKAGARYKERQPNARIVWIMNNPQFYHSRKKNALENVASIFSARREAAIAKKFARNIDWAIVYDKGNQRLSEAVGIKTKIIGNPLDYDYFYAPVKKITKGQEIQLLAVGALSPQRRFEEVVTATAILRKQGYHVRALIICKDYWSDKAYRRSFEDHIAQSGGAEFIDARFAGVDEKMMVDSIKSSHVSVVPQSGKVWIATACEAMAAGLPLVISRNTSMVDVLTDGKDALFFDALRADQVADKIKALIDDPARYEAVAAAGQKFVKDRLSFSVFVKEAMAPME